MSRSLGSCSLLFKTWLSKDILMPTGERTSLSFVEEEEEDKLSCSGRFKRNPAFRFKWQVGLKRRNWARGFGFLGNSSKGMEGRGGSPVWIDWADDIDAPSSGLNYRNWQVRYRKRVFKCFSYFLSLFLCFKGWRGNAFTALGFPTNRIGISDVDTRADKSTQQRIAVAADGIALRLFTVYSIHWFASQIGSGKCGLVLSMLSFRSNFGITFDDILRG